MTTAIDETSDVADRTPSSSRERSGRTFVVEDHDLVRALVSVWFTARGHLVESCAPARSDWMDDLNDEDLVVLDLCLGDRDGVEVLHALAERRFHGDVVLISAFPDTVLEAARAVAVEFGLHVLGALRKPIAFDRLETLLGTRRLRDRPRRAGTLVATSLAEALADARVIFHCQPILDARTRAVVSLEMLARIVGDDGRPTSVAGTLAEASDDVLCDLARHAFRSVDDIGRQLGARGIAPLPVAINVPSNFLQRRRFAPMLPLIERASSPITLEVSELGAFADPPEARRVTTSAVLRGLRLSLDDFGTQNSNIDRFVQLPFDELKLDRAYVSGCSEDSVHDTVCRAAVELAHRRDAVVVAEGVETAGDYRRMRELGVDRVQGYYFSPPLPVPALVDWILTHSLRERGIVPVALPTEPTGERAR